MIGDGLMREDKAGGFWMQAIAAKGGKLDAANLKQQAAEPLASFLRRDPWTDQLITLHAAYEPILMAADKMPFEVEPVYIKLTYYKAPADPATAPTGGVIVAPTDSPSAPAAATTQQPTPPSTIPPQP